MAWGGVAGGDAVAGGVYGAAARYEFATTMWRSLDKSRAPEQKYLPMLSAVILFLPTMSMFGCCRFGFGLAGAAAALVGIFAGAGLILDKVSFRHLPLAVAFRAHLRKLRCTRLRTRCLSGITCGCASADAPLSKGGAWGELAVLAVLAAPGFSGVPGAAWALAGDGAAVSGALVAFSGLRPQSSQ